MVNGSTSHGMTAFIEKVLMNKQYVHRAWSHESFVSCCFELCLTVRLCSSSSGCLQIGKYLNRSWWASWAVYIIVLRGTQVHFSAKPVWIYFTSEPEASFKTIQEKLILLFQQLPKHISGQWLNFIFYTITDFLSFLFIWFVSLRVNLLLDCPVKKKKKKLIKFIWALWFQSEITIFVLFLFLWQPVGHAVLSESSWQLVLVPPVSVRGPRGLPCLCGRHHLLLHLADLSASFRGQYGGQRAV